MFRPGGLPTDPAQRPYLTASVRRLVTDRLTGPSAAVPSRPLGTFQAASRFVLRHSLR
jgi:hypothetical protein